MRPGPSPAVKKRPAERKGRTLAAAECQMRLMGGSTREKGARPVEQTRSAGLHMAVDGRSIFPSNLRMVEKENQGKELI